MTTADGRFRDAAPHAKAWPFEEARRLLKRIGGKTPEKGYVLFETGYGPSGLPHIGTFGEVARTSMVRHAFEQLCDIPTKLIAFSDDMDGMRKVPDNVPNKHILTQHLGRQLTEVPDPFGTHAGFAQHNNARLREFLDQFGFDYEFLSSTECYTSGRFDAALLAVLKHYDAIQAIMLPTLGEERRASYSPFLPIDPESRLVQQVPVLETDPERGTILYRRADGAEIETKVTGGACKLQWKPDWAMRWFALDVDYEMSGKDLIESVKQSSQITRALGGRPPEGFHYELFLDEKGEKISKSKGNGLTMEEWLAYAPEESLALYMFTKPRTAKRLYFDIIPKTVDEYLAHLDRYGDLGPEKQIDNPLWHIHGGAPPESGSPLSFSLLLNLAGVCNTDDPSVLWGFISRYAPDATPDSAPLLDRLVGYAVKYYQDFVKPGKHYRPATQDEAAAIADLRAALAALPDHSEAEDIQSAVYAVGKARDYENLREWFQILYQVLLGQDQGPRMGSFIALYGQPETLALIDKALAGEDLSAA
ncbi:MAG: lysine--tRNA ligase [Alphaproteobacteria bacterium]|nr:lysine--tRNA ligase [Alphaproteobacteria bacterium]